MTLATEIYYTGYHPYTLERVYTARTKEEKESQRQFFFWYDRQRQQSIVSSLKRLHREDLIKRLFPSGIQPSYRRDDYTDKRQHRNNPPKRNRRK